jgi:hypothetical protein
MEYLDLLNKKAGTSGLQEIDCLNILGGISNGERADCYKTYAGVSSPIELEDLLGIKNGTKGETISRSLKVLLAGSL